MAQLKRREKSARTREDLQEYMQSLATAKPGKGSEELASLLAPKIGRVRLFHDDKRHRTMVQEVTLSNTRPDVVKLPKRSRSKTERSEELAKILAKILANAGDRDISVDLTLDLNDGSVSVAVESEAALEGQDLSTIARSLPQSAQPVIDDEPFGDEYCTADEAAAQLGVAKSTVTRRIKANEVIGFKLFKNALYVPREQFDGKSIIRGIGEVLEMFDNQHKQAWFFLSTALFYGSAAPRPIDRLRNVNNDAELQTCLAELKLAKDSLDRGDHF